MEKKIKELEERVDKLYTMLYSQRARSVNHIIMNNITDTEVISEELEKLLDCIEDKRFYNQFWKLIQYTEKFDDKGADTTVSRYGGTTKETC